jgi:hypothetical protein
MRPCFRPGYGFALVLASLVASSPLACSALKTDPGQTDASVDASDTPTDDAEAALDGGSLETSTPDAPTTPTTYDEAQAQLQVLRTPGPVTSQGSRVVCTDSYVAWRDSDGSVHTWSGRTTLRQDYRFKAPRLVGFAPSDMYIPADAPDYSTLDAYLTENGAKPGSAAYATYHWATNDGIIRLDQFVNGIDQNGTRVRFWDLDQGSTPTDIGGVLATRQPPLAYGLGKIVIPGGTTFPTPLYVVDIPTKTTDTLTFDAAIGIREVAVSELGVLVSYARTGPQSALRLYRKSNGTRTEVGDEVAVRPGLFPDSPVDEHKLLNRIAAYEGWVLYDSAFGIFGFHLDRGLLVALQLGQGKKAFLVDSMCVMNKLGLLAYRLNGDATGQVFTVPLARVLPP